MAAPRRADGFDWYTLCVHSQASTLMNSDPSLHSAPFLSAVVKTEPVPEFERRMPGRSLSAIISVTVFGLLLASFPARNSDLWQHLAQGRQTAAFAAASPTWLYDLLTYWTFVVAGGVGMVALKAMVVAGLAVLLLRVGRT